MAPKGRGQGAGRHQWPHWQVVKLADDSGDRRSHSSPGTVRRITGFRRSDPRCLLRWASYYTCSPARLEEQDQQTLVFLAPEESDLNPTTSSVSCEVSVPATASTRPSVASTSLGHCRSADPTPRTSHSSQWQGRSGRSSCSLRRGCHRHWPTLGIPLRSARRA
jgi:hypothetical protein